MATRVELSGLDGLLKRLNAFPKEMAQRGGPIRAALGKGAVVIRDQAKANVRALIAQPNENGLQSESTGALEKNIVATRSPKPRAINPQATEVYRVRIKRNAKRDASHRLKGKGSFFNEISRYATLLEFGTNKMRAFAWLRNAAQTKHAEAMNVIVRELTKGIARVERKVKALK